MTEITVPATITDRRIEVTATASLAAATLSAASLVIPMIIDPSIIEPTWVDAKPTIEVELANGTGDDRVGRIESDGFSVVQVPLSLDIDPRNGDIVVLDAPNHRLVILSGGDRSFRSVELPETGAKDELVINGDTGQATVSEFEDRPPDKYSTVHLVDLDTGAYTTSGPLLPPQEPPAFLAMIWSEANAEVYAELPIANGGYFPYYDTIHETLNISATPETWWSPKVEDGVGAGFIANGTTVLTNVPYDRHAIEDLRVATDRTIWWMVSTADLTEPSQPRVHLYLAHTDPACHTTIAAEIETAGIFGYSTTRVLAIDGATAYIARIRDHSYQIERYELPPITC